MDCDWYNIKVHSEMLEDSASQTLRGVMFKEASPRRAPLIPLLSKRQAP
ncbi:uncharacterized protein G2W53_028667 [Senna tora]|uniref:Uncharacterized protein n=1 Tax=Senna tora TaxID=362788 RepID=A0A834WAZ5_9FABA|nr:uncharacterized protein G2W53_028667 [Senna tora]